MVGLHFRLGSFTSNQYTYGVPGKHTDGKQKFMAIPTLSSHILVPINKKIQIQWKLLFQMR